jgi:hypothetical protein
LENPHSVVKIEKRGQAGKNPKIDIRRKSMPLKDRNGRFRIISPALVHLQPGW